MFRSYGPRKQKKRRNDRRRKIPLARVPAEIKLDSTSEIVEGRVFLNDLSPSGVGCFVNQKFDKGEKVTIVLQQPKHFYVKGEVIWCAPYTLSTKVLTKEHFEYRIGIKFLFDDEDDKLAVKKFCEELYDQSKD